jgi:hypothetical protein
LPPPPFHATSPHFPSYYAAVFTLFGSFVILSSRHPPRAIWTRRLSCLGRCVRCPPSLTRCPQSATLQLSSHSYSFCTTPFTNNLGVPPLLPRWGARGFLPPGGTRDPSVLCPLLFSWRRGFHCIFLGEHRFLFNFFRHDLCGHPFHHIRPHRPCNCLGWSSLECFSCPPSPLSPLTTLVKDLKPPRVAVG